MWSAASLHFSTSPHIRPASGPPICRPAPPLALHSDDGRPRFQRVLTHRRSGIGQSLPVVALGIQGMFASILRTGTPTLSESLSLAVPGKMLTPKPPLVLSNVWLTVPRPQYSGSPEGAERVCDPPAISTCPVRSLHCVHPHHHFCRCQSQFILLSWWWSRVCPPRIGAVDSKAATKLSLQCRGTGRAKTGQVAPLPLCPTPEPANAPRLPLPATAQGTGAVWRMGDHRRYSSHSHDDQMPDGGN